MALIYSPESEGFPLGSGGHLSASALITEPFAMSKMISHASKFSRVECSMESIPSGISTEISENLMVKNGGVKLISSLVDSPARISALQEIEPVLKAKEADYSLKYGEWFARLDRQSLSWKMYQQSLLPAMEKSPEKFPRAGIMFNGIIYPLRLWELRTREIDGLLLPTPTVHGNNNRKGYSKKSGDGLSTAVKKFPTPTVADSRRGKVLGAMEMFPTPTAHEAGAGEALKNLVTKDGRPAKLGERAYNPKTGKHTQITLNRSVKMFPTPTVSDAIAGERIPQRSKKRSANLIHVLRKIPTPTAQDGKNSTLPPSQSQRDSIPGYLIQQGLSGVLNPLWVEWLMGFPVGMTELEPLAMLLFPKW